MKEYENIAVIIKTRLACECLSAANLRDQERNDMSLTETMSYLNEKFEKYIYIFADRFFLSRKDEILSPVAKYV